MLDYVALSDAECSLLIYGYSQVQARRHRVDGRHAIFGQSIDA